MRKLIDIKEEDLKPLKIKAIDAGKDLKNYIQDLLSNDVKEFKKGNFNIITAKPKDND